MADGFKANVKFFKCDWTPRKPEDYLLSNALCLHIREMIELQNAIEVDNIKNVLILNKTDLRKYILDPERYVQVQNVWVNQNIILNAEEKRTAQAIGKSTYALQPTLRFLLFKHHLEIVCCTFRY